MSRPPGFIFRIRAAGRCYACIEFPAELAGGCVAFAYQKRVCRMCNRIHYRAKFPPEDNGLGEFVPGSIVVPEVPLPDWVN